MILNIAYRINHELEKSERAMKEMPKFQRNVED